MLGASSGILWGMNLCVTANGRFLEWEDGTPFFWLGDTAWELFHRLTLEEAKHYLDVRFEQGFTVIQAVLLAEFDGLTEPNREGHLPLHDLDPTRPNLHYFEHVDAILEYAESLGLIVGLLPTWGDKVVKAWGTGPVIFNPENAYAYGKWLGLRYLHRENLIWINGGDRKPKTDDEIETFRKLGQGLRDADPNHLIAFHPQGNCHSSDDFHNDDWLDINQIQSGHGARWIDNAAMVDKDYALEPPKPTLDAEPNYENHAINWKNTTSRFRDEDVRISLWRSVLAGACGVTYGCQDVWQFFDPERHPAVAYADTPWQEALHFSGAWQVRHLRSLMEERDFTTGEPAQERVLSEETGARCLVGEGYLLCYLPLGGEVTLSVEDLGFELASVCWFDPRTGIAVDDDEIDCAGEVLFSAPTEGRHNDWVLCVEASEIAEDED